jgi:hypothetical protein
MTFLFVTEQSAVNIQKIYRRTLIKTVTYEFHVIVKVFIAKRFGNPVPGKRGNHTHCLPDPFPATTVSQGDDDVIVVLKSMV